MAQNGNFDKMSLYVDHKVHRAKSRERSFNIVPLSSNVTSGRLQEWLLGGGVQGPECSSTVGLS